MNKSKSAAIIFAVMSVCAASAQAQEGHDAWVKVGANLFGNDEKSVYGSIAVGESLGHNLRLQLGATASPFRSFGLGSSSIRYGGSDVELLGTYRWKTIVPIDLSAGVDQPRTPARTATAFTYRALANLPGAKSLTWYANAYGIVGLDSIAMAGVGVKYAFCPRLSLEASGALPVQGNNSVSPSSGNRDRLGVYSVGLSTPVMWGTREATLGLAITNQLGWTTGMAATPTLGGFPGLSVSLQVRF